MLLHIAAISRNIPPAPIMLLCIAHIPNTPITARRPMTAKIAIIVLKIVDFITVNVQY